MRTFTDIKHSSAKKILAYRCQSKGAYTSAFFRSLVFCCLAIAGCARYSVSVNDRPVYTPPKILEESLIEDTALSTCVQQTIEDHTVRKITDLKWLDCDYAAISSLQGLSNYSRIERLSLRHNSISNIDELLRLTHLIQVDLSENPELTCDHLTSLQSAGIETINSSLQCK